MSPDRSRRIGLRAGLHALRTPLRGFRFRWLELFAAACASTAHAQPDVDTSRSQPGAADSAERTTPSDVPKPEELERRGARIGNVDVIVHNVFNTDNPEEDKRLYRFANRIHFKTRESVIRDILLFSAGDSFDARVIEESARLLRGMDYLVEALIAPVSYDAATNTVNVRVEARDAWSLSPDLKLSRSGGENEWGIGFEDSNILGTGRNLTVSYSSDVDRDEAYFGYSYPNVRGSRVALDFARANRSDGDLTSISAGRPFFALDTRWSISGSVSNDERIDPIYDLGETIEKFRHETKRMSIEGGWTRGLIDRRARRWLFGLAYEEDVFAPTPEYTDLSLLPRDRELVYPWIGFQLIEDDFRIMTELNDMGRTEDIPLGLNVTAKVGFAMEALGSDRDATLFEAEAHKGWEPGGAGRLLLLDASASTRREGDEQVDSVVSVGARYYHRNLKNHLFSASLDATTTHHLDPESQVLLGGDNGLRGYPLRYQSGKHRAVLSLEQRFFTDWYPLRLFRVGYAVFFDAGRVWGRDPRGEPSRGMLYDVGIGLRLTSPRSSGRSVVHIDLAFPLGSDDESADGVQFVVGTKRSF